MTNEREQKQTCLSSAERRGIGTSVQICKTDLEKIIKYLEDATALYDKTKGQKYISRAWRIRNLTRKLKTKLFINK